MASLSLGAGETIMATGLGAWSEYGLLWLLVLSVVVKGVFVMYLIGRYTAITGQSVGRRLVMCGTPQKGVPSPVIFVCNSKIALAPSNDPIFDRNYNIKP